MTNTRAEDDAEAHAILATMRAKLLGYVVTEQPPDHIAQDHRTKPTLLNDETGVAIEKKEEPI